MRNLFPAPFVLVYSKRFSLTKKRKYVRTKTPLRLNQNVLAFRIKRLCVFFQTYLRFGSVSKITLEARPASCLLCLLRSVNSWSGYLTGTGRTHSYLSDHDRTS